MNHELLNLARSLGSDEAYRKWVQKQRSCLSGQYSEILESGEGRCIAAHVRRVHLGSGTGRKPPYSAIPLTFDEHAYAHQHGDGELMAPHKWELLAERYLRAWISSISGT
jgi:hypothetical protein